MNTTTEKVILRWADHPAPKAVEEKIKRAKADAIRLRDSAAEFEAKAERLRITLGRLEIDAELGKKVDVAGTRKALIDLEAKAQAARAESARRDLIAEALQVEFVKSIRAAISEIQENAGYLVRELTDRYIEAVETCFQLGSEIDAIYADLRSGSHGLYSRHGIHAPEPIHENPVLKFKTDPRFGEYTRAMERYLDTFKKLGY